MSEIKVGSIIAWRGNGFLFIVLSFILSLVDPAWRRRRWKPWHLSFVIKKLADDDWLICEATWPRVRTMPLSVLDQIYKGDFRVIDWFGKPVSQGKVSTFVKERIGAKYDALVYVFTIIQYIIYKYSHIQLGRYNDGAYMCWEITAEFCEVMGEGWESTQTIEHKYPLISEFMNEVDAL